MGDLTMEKLELWQPEEFIANLKAVGATRYHSFHPFNIAMNAGKLDRNQMQRWIVNRFYYQACLPQKDAAIIANCPIREVRRNWIHRVLDHDGSGDKSGGIEAWLRFGEAMGIGPEALLDSRFVLPGTRFAVDAYVNFVRTKPWPIAVASSLTELFAPDHMRDRVEAFKTHYPWIPSWGFDYFNWRVVQARVDSGEAIDIVIKYCDTPELQAEAVRALEFKCDVLWSLLDAVQNAEETGPIGG